MLHQLSFAIVLLAFGSFTYAQLPFPGKCPDVNPPSEFDLDAFTGIWYEYSKYPFIFEIGKKCVYAEYHDLGNDTVSVTNNAISRLTGQPSSISGYAKVLGPARLAVVFRPGQSETEPNYIILGTDYKNYAVIFSCTNFSSVLNTRIVWILTRQRKPSEEAIQAAKKVIDDNGLSQTFLSETLQEDCPDVDNTGSDGSTSSNAINKV